MNKLRRNTHFKQSQLIHKRIDFLIQKLICGLFDKRKNKSIGDQIKFINKAKEENK